MGSLARGVVAVETGQNYFFWYRSLYEEALERRVCLSCEKWRGKHTPCLTSDPKGCGVFRYLPQLVKVAQKMGDCSAESYVRAVRAEVGMRCGNPNRGEPCRWRDTLDCGMEEHLPYVLEVVREVEASLKGGECHE